jgi:hypothetical protein
MGYVLRDTDELNDIIQLEEIIVSKERSTDAKKQFLICKAESIELILMLNCF